jgi:hypothetical protein
MVSIVSLHSNGHHLFFYVVQCYHKTLFAISTCLVGWLPHVRIWSLIETKPTMESSPSIQVKTSIVQCLNFVTLCKKYCVKSIVI